MKLLKGVKILKSSCLIFVIFPPDLKEMYSVMILHYYFTQKVHFEFFKLKSELKIEIGFSTISAI